MADRALAVPLRRSKRVTKKDLLRKDDEEKKRILECQDDRLLGLEEVFVGEKGRGVKVSSCHRSNI